jgi:hypothetical protein
MRFALLLKKKEDLPKKPFGHTAAEKLSRAWALLTLHPREQGKWINSFTSSLNLKTGRLFFISAACIRKKDSIY